MYESSFHKKWISAVNGKTLSEKLVPVYSLRTLSITKAPIESLVDVFSYDDASGKEVARIISF